MYESTEWAQPPLKDLEEERVMMREKSATKFKKLANKFGSALDMFRKV